jgi:hypothetical protein
MVSPTRMLSLGVDGRGRGPTNEIKSFENETADYRGGDTFLYNASWRFLEPENLGTFYITSTPAGEVFPNRYQVLDQIICTRGLLKQTGLRLNLATVDIHRTLTVATPSDRPRPFNPQGHLRPSPGRGHTRLLTPNGNLAVERLLA